MVLKEKGCQNSMTAHKLLYQSYPRGDGTYFHKIKRPIEPYKLIVVDEVSMLPKEMWDLLLSHGIHVIALGDPFQLPAITEDNEVLQNPHIFLDEIMRQAAESEIIQLTMGLRDFKPLIKTKGQEVQVIDANEVIDGMYTWADQVIVAKNSTRNILNQKIRELKYNVDSSLPIEGDKVICLRNYWDHPSAAGDVLVNGSIGELHNIDILNNQNYIGKAIKSNFILDEYLQDNIDNIDFNLIFHNLKLDYKLLVENEPTINKNNWKKIPNRFKPFEFDYAQAITCWKAQGSEYDKVLAFEENFPFDKVEHFRYLYTAATRARSKLVLVRNN